MLPSWIRRPQGQDAATAVFVHGILSEGTTCWGSGGAPWPEILRHEPALNNIGIYVFDYRTLILSGSYRLSDAVDHLKEMLKLDGVNESRTLIFVCHSMGGILVRKFIVDQALYLYESSKRIGLFLIASPSLGSQYADWLSFVFRLVHNAQMDTLRFVTDNQWLADLDKNFINLKEHGRITIHGKELTEDRPITFTGRFGRPIVETFSAARYFGDSYKVPGSDHISISKPESPDAIQHRLLCKFIVETLRLPRVGKSAIRPPVGKSTVLPDREVKPDIATYLTDVFAEADLWNRAHWRAIIYMIPSLQLPPILGLGFINEDAALQIFQRLRERYGEHDRFEELRVSFIEGAVKGLEPELGYSLHVGVDQKNTTTRLKQLGILTDGEMFSAGGVFHRMSNIENMKTFKASLQKSQFYYLAPYLVDDAGQVLKPLPDLTIIKKTIHFRNVSDIGANDLDIGLFSGNWPPS